jgi:tRNA-splicing ligase RtcB
VNDSVVNDSLEQTAAPLASWLAMPMETGARTTIERVRRAADVVRVAVMPDVHLAQDTCVGTVMATRRLLYPLAVGGDIGCGMLACALDGSADLLHDPRHAGGLLRLLGERIPIHRRHRSRSLGYPATLNSRDLSHGALRATADGAARLQLGTLGGGNHFVEIQRDAEDRLWVMIHSGSRVFGQEVKSHHIARATIRSASMPALDGGTDEGAAYLHDQKWARDFAEANRQAMLREVEAIVREEFKVAIDESSRIACDHNHVRREEHFGEQLFVHRKGAMPADAGLPGVIPGSMGTQSVHVEGLGSAESLRSSAHGAGRLLSRSAARERFIKADIRRQMEGVWFDPRIIDSLREESPKSYKDVRAVLRAQTDLVRVTRTLHPLLVYKGG